jgi:hypothetical protein
MKKSQLKNYIKENIKDILNTEELDLDEITVVDKNTKPEEVKDKDPLTVKTAIGTAKKSNKPVTIAEKDEDEASKEEISKNRSDIKGTEAYKRAEWKARYGSMKGFDKAYPQYSKTSSTELKEVSKKSKEQEEDEGDDWYKSKDEDGDKDKEPSKSDLKKDAKATKGVAKAKDELATLTREMKSLAKKYKEAKGAEKDKIVADLKAKTKLKKELESILDR